MKLGFWFVLIIAGCIAVGPQVYAQSPAGGDGSGSGQSKPAADGQKPAGAQPQAPAQTESNPFPEDTSTVPVMPSKGEAVLPEGTYSGNESGRVALPGEDTDPVRSPDDPALAPGGQPADSSSSLAGLDKLVPVPDDDQPDTEKKRKLAVKEPTHQEAASTDIDVGNYYLQTRNWKAALSRFQSAMVLDPENPDVYWGLAESEHHLGDFADARAHYLKVVDYDPDSRHGKDARKALKEPEIANVKASSAVQPTEETSK
jgi:hypothetical protein